MKRVILCFLVFIVGSLIIASSPSSQDEKSAIEKHRLSNIEMPEMVDGKGRWIPVKNFIDSSIRVQGLAWGEGDKGLGEKILFNGGEVYVSGVNYSDHGANGRLVEIVGILRFEKMTAAPPGVQGYGGDFHYYTIEATSLKLLQRVTIPYIKRILPHDR